MEAAREFSVAPDHEGLSDRDARILEFEHTWWQYPGAKEQAIRDLFDMSATRYYQVLNAIMQSGKHNKRWDSLYAVAVKAYELETHFTEEQTRKYKAWRQALIDRIDADDEAYLRPATFDALLSALFPEMAEGIGKGYGRVKEQK